VGYRADAVQNFFSDGSRYQIDIQYAMQVAQDGTGRVVDLARGFASHSPFVLAYGDILVDPVNDKRMVDLANNVEALISVTSDGIRDLAQIGTKVQALELTGEWTDVRDPEILARLNK